MSPSIIYAYNEPETITSKINFFPKSAAHVESLKNKFVWKNSNKILTTELSANASKPEFAETNSSELQPILQQNEKDFKQLNQEEKEANENSVNVSESIVEILDAGGMEDGEIITQPQSEPEVDSESEPKGLLESEQKLELEPFQEQEFFDTVTEPEKEKLLGQTEEEINQSAETAVQIPVLTPTVENYIEPTSTEDSSLPEAVMEGIAKLAEQKSVVVEAVPEPRPENSEASSFLEAWDFTKDLNEKYLPDLKYLESFNLNISMSGSLSVSGKLVFSVLTEDTDWQDVYELDLVGEFSNNLNGGYFQANIPKEVLEKINSVKLRVAYVYPQTETEILPQVFIDSLWFTGVFQVPKPNDEEFLQTLEDRLINPEEFLKMEMSSENLEVSLPSDLGNPITLGFAGTKKGPDLKMFLASKTASSTAFRKGDMIVYKDAYESTDVEYKINKKGLKENIVLKDSNHPGSFKYVVNFSDYDLSQVSDSQINLYQKGFKDQPLKLFYKITAPYMEDAKGHRSEQIELKLKNNVLEVVPNEAWLQTASYPVIVDPSVEINVLNVHSHPAEGEFWDVDFTTLGTEDLSIIPADQATITDDEFTSLFCGQEDRTQGVQILPGDVIYYPNWSCDEVATVRHMTLYAGSHHLYFQFGDAFSEAFNAAYTWDGGGGDALWTTADNWSSDIVPTASDTVTINNSCASNCNPVINTTTSITGLTISSATTTVTLQDGFTLTVGASGFTQSNGTFNGGVATTTIGGAFTLSGGTFNAASTTVFAGGVYTININTTQNFHHLVFNGTSGTTKTISTGDTLVALGDLYLTDSIVNLSSYANPGIIDARGNITTASTFDGGTAIVDFGDDAVDQTWTVNGGTSLAFRLNSGADATDNVVINAAAAFQGATITPSFSGTIPISNPSNYDLTFGASATIPAWTQAAGTFNGGLGTTTFANSNFTILGGTFNAASNTIFSGISSSININSSQQFYNLHINANSVTTKTISTGNVLIVNGTLYLNSGNLGGGTVKAMGDIIQSSSMEGSTATVDFDNDSLSQTWTVNGGTGPILRLDSAADASDVILINSNGGFYGATISPAFVGVIPFSNSGAYNVTFSTGGYVQHAGNFNGWAGTTTVSGAFTISGGTYNASTNTVVTGLSTTLDFNSSQEFYNFSFSQNNISGKTIAAGDTLIVLNNLAFNDGQVSSSGIIEARGNVKIASVFDGATTPLRFTGSSTSGSVDQTFDLSGTNYLYDGDITINKSEGEVRLLSNLLTNANNQDILITSGTLNLNGNNLSATGTGGTLMAQGGVLKLVGHENVTTNANYPILASTSTVEYYGTTTTYNLKNFTYGGLKISGSGGTFLPGSTTLSVLGDFTLSAGTFTASSTTNIYGNFINAGGTFNHNSNTVSLLGGNQTILGSNTFYNLSKSTSTAYTLTFASGTTQTILNTLTLEGASGQQLNLRSDTNGSYWYIDPQGSRAISYLNVQDSNNSNLTSINAIGTGSTNSGNNINWDFGTSYEQNQYQFYQNTDALQPVTSLGSLNSTTTITTTSSPIRLRMNITIASVDLATSSGAFILQFATTSTGTWTSVGSGQTWQFYNNTSVSNTSTISSMLLPASDVLGLYMESSPTGQNPNFAAVGQDVEFDFVLNPTSASMTTYLFRMVRSDGAVFSTYNNYAALTVSINSAPTAPTALGPANLVNGSYTSSTQPSLTFSLADSDGSDTLRFQIQVSTSSSFSSYAVNYTSALASQGSRSFTVGQATGTGSYASGFAGQSLANGNYYWRVLNIDNSGATSTTSTARSGLVAFIVNNSVPTAGTLTASATATSSLSAAISGASDSGSGLSLAPYIFYNATVENNSGATSSDTWIFSSLSPNTLYEIYADVYNNASTSASSTEDQVYTLAESPSSLVLSAVSQTQISANWSANGNPAGTQYLVTNETSGINSGWITATSASFSSLTCATAYTFSVIARNGDSYITASTSSVTESTSACDSENSGGGSSSGGSGGGSLYTPPVFPSLPFPNIPPVLPPAQPASPASPVSVNPNPSTPVSPVAQTPNPSLPAVVPPQPPSSSGGVGFETSSNPTTGGNTDGAENIFEQIVEKIPEFPQITLPNLSKVSEKIGEVVGNVANEFNNTLGGFSVSMQGATIEFSRAVRLGISKVDFRSLAKIPAWVSSNWPQKSEIAQGVVLLTFVPGLIAAEYSIAVQGLNLGLGSFYDLWLSFVSMVHGLFTSLGLRKRRRIWGTVYDSENKQPLDPAMVTLTNIKTGKVVQSSITDLYGRFGFLDKPGEYVISAKKTHYQFPSVKILGQSDGIFTHLYHGEKIIITPGEELLVPNVPMDPMEFDWNQEEKNKMLKFSPRLEHAVQIFLQVIFWFGFAFAAILLLRDTTIFNTVLISFYVFMAFLRKYIPYRHLWGRIVSVSQNVEGLLLELTHPKIQTVVLARAITSKNGKFFLKAQAGEFVLKIKRVEGDTVTVVLEKAVKVGRDGVVNEEFKI